MELSEIVWDYDAQRCLFRLNFRSPFPGGPEMRGISNVMDGGKHRGVLVPPVSEMLIRIRSRALG